MISERTKTKMHELGYTNPTKICYKIKSSKKLRNLRKWSHHRRRRLIGPVAVEIWRHARDLISWLLHQIYSNPLLQLEYMKKYWSEVITEIEPFFWCCNPAGSQWFPCSKSSQQQILQPRFNYLQSNKRRWVTWIRELPATSDGCWLGSTLISITRL